eukprot:5605413-Amphidinium_carterae.2
MEAPAVLLSHNLLEGAIPQHLLHGRDALEKWVVARTLESRVMSSRQTKLTLNCACNMRNPSGWRVVTSAT